MASAATFDSAAAGFFSALDFAASLSAAQERAQAHMPRISPSNRAILQLVTTNPLGACAQRLPGYAAAPSLPHQRGKWNYRAFAVMTLLTGAGFQRSGSRNAWRPRTTESSTWRGRCAS